MDTKLITKKLFKYLRENYNLKDVNIYRKCVHIGFVAKYCLKIAKELHFNKIDTQLAYIIGLFHDYGRFEQWVRYGTYDDNKSCSHAQLGTKLLFTKNHICRYNIPKEYYSLIKTAIDQHSNLEIDKNITDSKTLMFCKLIRDADKINLYELNISGVMPINYNLNGFTLEAYEQLKNAQCVNKKFVNTKLDGVLLSLGTIYDLNFKFSFKKLEKMKYFKKLQNRFMQVLTIEDDKKILLQAVELTKNNLKKRELKVV